MSRDISKLRINKMQATFITLCALLLLCFVLGFTSFAFISLIIILYIISRLLPLPTFGYLGRLPVAYTLIVCGISFIGVFGWLSGVPLSLSLIIAILAIVSFILVLLTSYKNPHQLTSKLKICTFYDAIAIGVGILTLILVFIPVMPKPNAALLAPVIIAGGDNSAHLEMIKTNDFNKGYSIGIDNRFDMASNLYSYPQGWHLNAAVTKWLIDPFTNINDSPGKILLFFHLFSGAWLGLLTLLIARISLHLIDLIKKSRQQKWLSLGSMGLLLAAVGGWVIPIFASGFQPQISSLVLFLSSLLFIIEAIRRGAIHRYPILLIALFIVASISLFWIFVFPVAIICAGFFIMHTIYQNRKWPPLYFILGTITIILSACFQLYTQICYPESGGGFDAYGYMPYSIEVYPLLVLTLIVGLIIYIKKSSPELRTIFKVTVISLIFTVVILLIQLGSYGEARYYYYKSIPTVIVLLTIIFTVLSYSFLVYISKGSLRTLVHKALFVIIVIVMLFSMFMAFRSPEFDAYFNKTAAGISHEQAEHIVSLIGSNPINGYRIAPIGSCDRGDDIRASLLSRALTYTPTAYINKEPGVVLTLTASTKEVVYEQIDYFLTTYQKPLYVISRNQSLNQDLISYVGENAKYLDIIDVDPDPPATVLANCPDRLGSKP